MEWLLVLQVSKDKSEIESEAERGLISESMHVD